MPGTGIKRAFAAGGAIAACALLAGCSDSLPSLPKMNDLNPFKKEDPPLPGRRIAVLKADDGMPGQMAEAPGPITLPPARANDTWTQPGGEANNAPGHLALTGARQKAWSADAGTGSSKTGRVTATPVVFDGRVFTLDADGLVSAFSVNGGSAIWSAKLKPNVADKPSPSFTTQIFSLGSGDGGGGYGGGLAIDGGKLFAASGYGAVFALDPATGKAVWEKNLGVPVRAAPTAIGDRVYIITADGRFICMSGVDGTELWAARGLPQQASRVMNVSPAVDNDIVVVPYPSGDVVAVKVLDGTPVWSETLTRPGQSTSQLATLSGAARPVIDGGMVFAVSNGGRMVAAQSANGERVWSLNVPGTQAPCVAGDSVFVVDTGGQLMAINRRDGKIQWTTKLPGGTTFAGPVLAGGLLYLTSNTGQLVSVDASTGQVSGQQDLGDPVFVPPIVAQGRLYVLTDDARLIALN